MTGVAFFGQQSFQVDRPNDVVQTQFDELSSLLRDVPMFGDHHAMTPTPDGNCNHKTRKDEELNSEITEEY